MSQGFQSELRDALDEPMREMRSTADMARRAIEEPVDEISGSAKGIGQAATDAFAAATKFSAAPVQGGGAEEPSPADKGRTSPAGRRGNGGGRGAGCRADRRADRRGESYRR